MVFRIIISTVLFCIAFAVYDIPAEYKDLLSQPAKDYYDKLSDLERNAILEVAQIYANTGDSGKVIQELKKKSPELGDKAEKLFNVFEKSFKSLGDEAREFAMKVFREASKMFVSVVSSGQKPTINEIRNKVAIGVKKYNALSETAKAEYKQQFPVFTSLFRSDKFQQMIDSAKN
ncbi:nematode fatty acid retinoid binding protein [Dictyocaulus viviparus]|uniref:Fatty-acid and retinol-binding protein 1 n=1 Tax=Dictyocaulus viviparus TaxID=29172 RepID=A0A0D8XLM9_DICVI|nr:nematode fatty acid retinoid binding protein [Dictyocaulus viviparus]